MFLNGAPSTAAQVPSGLVFLPPSLEDGQLCVQPVTTTQEEKSITDAHRISRHKKDVRMQDMDDAG